MAYRLCRVGHGMPIHFAPRYHTRPRLEDEYPLDKRRLCENRDRSRRESSPESLTDRDGRASLHLASFELLPQRLTKLWQADVTYIHIPAHGWWHA